MNKEKNRNKNLLKKLTKGHKNTHTNSLENSHNHPNSLIFKAMNRNIVHLKTIHKIRGEKFKLLIKTESRGFKDTLLKKY